MNWKRNLAALWVAQLLSIMSFYTAAPYFPLFVKELGVEGDAAAVQWAGLILGGGTAVVAIMQPIWGALGDRWGYKPMLLRALVAGGVVGGATILVVSPEQLLAVRLFQGAFIGTTAAATALVATATPRQNIGFALGLVQVAYFVGVSFGQLIGGVATDLYGYRAVFLLSAVMSLLAVPLVIWFVHEEREPSPTTSKVNRGILRGSWEILSIGFLPMLISIIFLIQFGGQTVNPMLSLFVVQLSGGENGASLAGVILAATGAVSAMSAAAVGRIGDRIGHVPVLLLCLLGVAVACFPQAFVQQVWELLVLRMLMGAFLGGLMPSANALVARLVPNERRGSVFGLTAAASAFAIAASPIFGANVATQWGMRSVFVATGALFVLSFGWAGFALRGNNRLMLEGTPNNLSARDSGEVSTVVSGEPMPKDES